MPRQGPPVMVRKRRPTPYEVLGLQDNCSEDDIKKSFRRLALKLHPDKQQGVDDQERAIAEQRFKQVNEAYSVLSDAARRARYDQYGDEDEDDDAPQSGRRAPSSAAQYAVLSVEELLAMTFGARRRRYPFLSQEPNLLMVIQLIVPLSIAIALSIFPPRNTPPGYDRAEPPFQTRAQPPYTHERRSAQAGVEYFVRDGFEEAFGADRWAMAAVEAAVESLKREAVRDSCDVQRKQWQARVDAARRTPKGPDRDVRVREAEAQPTPACDELEARFGEARTLAESLRKVRETPWRGAAWGSYVEAAAPRVAPAAAHAAAAA